MTPRKNRASKKILDKIWKQGKVARFGSLTFRFTETKNSATPRISFIVPKTAGSAVLRNTLRRRGYAALKPHLPSLPAGLTGALIFNPKEKDEKSSTQINKLVSEILKAFL